MLLAGCLVSLVCPIPTAGQDTGCDGLDNSLTDLQCFPLTPVPEFRGASGMVLLRPASTPFGFAVTADGRPRYAVELVLRDMPTDSALVGYHVWATTEFFEQIADFGIVTDLRSNIGVVEANKFVVFVGYTSGGRIRTVLRGSSPSTRLMGHDPAFSSPLAALNPGASSNQPNDSGHNHGQSDEPWPHPPMHPAVPMAPGMLAIRPQVSPYTLRIEGPDGIPLAEPGRTVHLADGDTLDLTAGPVRRQINGRDLILLGYNGQYPGPMIRADEASTIVVRFHNNVDAPTAVHWHGIRIENAFDGVPGVTQDPVQYGEEFLYRVRLPDPGLYWYHPHHREDIFQELGLYGNLLVDPLQDGYYRPVDQEAVLILDDMLLADDGPISFGTESANYMFMGRFGNTYLINGAPEYSLDVRAGSAVRLYLTNVSNTRTFNLNIPGTRVKVIASDVSRFEREEWVESIVIAPAERYIVEARFDSVGTFPATNQVQALNHTAGTYFPEVDTLGFFNVLPTNDGSVAREFDALRTHEEVVVDIDRYRRYFDRAPDHNLLLTLETKDLPPIVEQTMSLEAAFFSPIEWSGTMPMMNWASTGAEVRWLLRDTDSGLEDMAIDWQFSVGEVVKIRVRNDRDAFHAMQHPLHIHGQRFLVVSQNGVETENLVWKDTVILPSGSTTDLLLDLTNPGEWMIHCHIAEHLESGMKMTFRVRQVGLAKPFR